MEYIDLYNEDRIPLNKKVIRYTPLEKGEYRLVVHLVIFNSKGEILIQKRSPNKFHWPNLWDITVGGQVSSGENTKQAIQRELFEELSINKDFSNIRPIFTFNFNQGFDDIFLYQEDYDLSQLVLQQEEVVEVKYASVDEIMTLINNKEFVQYTKEYLELLKSTLSDKSIYDE